MWEPETFEIAFPTGAQPRDGYTYRGLGLFMAVEPCVHRGRKPLWNLSHLGTGHLLALIEGDVRTAFLIAAEIAESGDWDFLSLEGFKDRFPDAPEKLAEICEANPRVKDYAKRMGEDYEIDARNRAVAQQIASNRP